MRCHVGEQSKEMGSCWKPVLPSVGFSNSACQTEFRSPIPPEHLTVGVRNRKSREGSPRTLTQSTRPSSAASSIRRPSPHHLRDTVLPELLSDKTAVASAKGNTPT